MNIAAQARAAAQHCEAKKDRLVQGQSGDWRVTFTVSPLDMPASLMAARPGTRYQLAIVEIGDDEQPVSAPSEPGASPESCRGTTAPPATPEKPVKLVAAEALPQAEGGERAAPTREAPQRCPTAAPLDSGARAVQRAGILCADQQFQEWLFRETYDKSALPTLWHPTKWEEWAATTVRQRCGVITRKQFHDDPIARAAFHAIEVSFAQATGRMAKDMRS